MYAPIIIPTLNRYDHLVRCIESLKKNPLASETELYISLDYPPSEKYVGGYLKVKNYLENELNDGFKSIKKFYQKENLNAYGNMIFLYKEAFKYYDKCIYTEDDNEFAPNFLDYINKGLELFENDEEIFAISGYNDGRPWNFKDGNVAKIKILQEWGMGVWKNKIEKAWEWINRKNFENILYDKNKCELIYNARYKTYYVFIQSLLANPADKSVYICDGGEIASIDYTFGVYLIIMGKVSIIPKVSLVRNWGFDGSGVNCVIDNNYVPETTVIDCENFFEYKLPKTFEYDKMNAELNREISYKKLADNAKIYRNIMCTLGIPVARKINNAVYIIKKNKIKLTNIIRKKK